MQYRRLKGTDLDVSLVCYGPMRLAQSKEDPNWSSHERAFSAAVDRGINFIHSSYEYGVRWMLHEVLKDHPKRSELKHVIKIPVPDWDDGEFDPALFEARIDEALGELCTDRIDLVQWMWRCRPHEETPRLDLLSTIADRVLETADRMKQKGKIGHLGCFPYFPQSAEAAMALNGMDVLIAYYNLLELEMAPLVEKLDERDKGFLAIRPLHEGVLTDKYPDQDALPQDHRLAKDKYRALFEQRDAIMRQWPEAEGQLTRFAARFPLLSPNCASIIVGLNSPQQVHEICAMVEDVTPDPALVARLRHSATQSQ